MKFNDLFKNKKNVQLTVMIIFVLLLAGGVWQYRNFVNDKLAQMENEDLMDDYEDSQLGDVSEYNIGMQIIDEKASEGIDKDQPIKEVLSTDSSSVKDAEKQKADSSNTNSNNSNTTVSTIKASDEKMEAMVLPVFGSMNSDFCDTALMYSKTLDQWTTHNGIDIKAEEGSQVRAAMDGVVVQTIKDPQWGLTIVIDHGSGIVTKYSNLSTLDLISIGQNIKKGDVISGVGKTALCEIVEEPHLHFEVLKDGKHIDPKNYLPRQSLNR